MFRRLFPDKTRRPVFPTVSPTLVDHRARQSIRQHTPQSNNVSTTKPLDHKCASSRRLLEITLKGSTPSSATKFLSKIPPVAPTVGRHSTAIQWLDEVLRESDLGNGAAVSSIRSWRSSSFSRWRRSSLAREHCGACDAAVKAGLWTLRGFRKIVVGRVVQWVAVTFYREVRPHPDRSVRPIRVPATATIHRTW